MGHIAVEDGSPTQFALTRISQQLWREAMGELPENVEYDECGTLRIATGEEQMSAARRTQELFAKHRIASFLLDPAQTAEAEPNLRTGLAGSLLVPGDAMIYPPCAASALLDRAREGRIAIRLNEEVASVSPGEITVRDGTKIIAKHIVIACGLWSPKFCAGISLVPCRSHLVETDRYPRFVRRKIIELGAPEDAAATFDIQPRRTGQMLVGSSWQRGASDEAVDHEILGRMLAHARNFLPSFGGMSVVRAWTGTHVVTPDGFPLIGPCPGHDKIWLATGHGQTGVTTALATARLLLDQLLNRKSAIPLEPYLPSRFAKQGASND
jgi:glycine/D-amino acid oxidase-like deaminating enzyme